MKLFSPYLKTFVALFVSGAMAVPLLLNSRTAQTAPRAKSARSAAKPAKANSKQLRLRRHTFPDVTMGVREAYAVLLPVGWSAKGHIEWQPSGDVSFPQQKIEIDSPQKGHISFEPLMTFTYTEAEGIGRKGIPAPNNLPQWLVAMIPQADPKIRNVKLVSSKRDAKVEAFMNRIDAQTNGGNGIEREVHVIVVDYDEGNMRKREEVSMTYVRFQPMISQGFQSQMWSLAPMGAISAPINSFAAQRKSLLTVAGTLRATPQWHVQSQAAIAEMSRQRTANNWEVIKARGQQIGKMSDEAYARYKQNSARSDAAQRARIDRIYETDDYRDTGGNIVNLPTEYNHVFSDGKGNYVLSNNSFDRPGSTWKAIRPMK